MPQSRIQSPQPRPFVPGRSFKNGKFYSFQSNGVTVLKPWPPQAWRKTVARPWWRSVRAELSLLDIHRFVDSLELSVSQAQARQMLICEPTGQLCLPFNDELSRLQKRATEGRAFLECIPKSALMAVQGFVQRQFHMLSLIARCPGAEELSRTSPALAFMLANIWVFRRSTIGRPMRAARRMMGRRMPQILARLGFPNSRAAARIVAKVPPLACYVDRLLYLRGAFSNPRAFKAMCHLGRINGNVIRVVSDPQLLEVASMRLLKEMGESTEKNNQPELAWRLGRLKALAAVCKKSGRLGKIECLSQLTAMHEALQKKVGLQSEEMLKGRLPAPPFAGTNSIVALHSPALVVREGVEQRNCAGSYLERVAMGRVYLYKMTSPQRCTISLERNKSGWHLGEFQARAGTNPTGAALDAAHSWLSRVAPELVIEDKWEAEAFEDRHIPF